MPVNPQTQKLIDYFANIPSKPVAQMSVEEIRQIADDVLELAGEPLPVESVKEFSIPGPTGNIPIYFYSNYPDETLPIIINYSGSGFVNGANKQQHIFCRLLANHIRCHVMTIIYHSAPEYPFPCGLHDSFVAAEWAFQHADEYHIDANKIGLCGSSSGGNFAALTAIHCRDKGLHCAFQILVAPALDLSRSLPSHERYGEGYLLSQEEMDFYYEHYLPKNIDLKDPHISPLFVENLSHLPPTLMINPEYDPLSDEGEAYAKRLEQAGVPVTHLNYKGQCHGFIWFRKVLDQERDAILDIAAFVGHVV